MQNTIILFKNVVLVLSTVLLPCNLTEMSGILQPPVWPEEARRGRGRGSRGGGGAGGWQLDPTQKGRSNGLRGRGGRGEHHGHSDEIPARSAAGHAEEVGL